MIGVIGQLLIILLGIFLPKFFITGFGSEINGLVSSISQIYVYVNLLEAGVGLATIQALYKPLLEDDKNKINGILSATHQYYQKTATLYAVFMIAFAVVYGLFLRQTIGFWTVFLIVIFTGLSSVLNYLFYGKYKLLFEAEGKNYISLSLNVIVSILSSIVKIILIMKGFNVVVVQFSFCVLNCIQWLVISLIIKQKYPWIDLKKEPDVKAISKKNAVLVHQLSYMIFSNTDILLLTIFTNLKIVSVYTIYSLFFKTVSTILSIANNAGNFYLGQIYQKNHTLFKSFVTLNQWLYFTFSFACYTTLYIVLIPFLKLYTRGFNDVNYIDATLALLFLIIEILKIVKPVLNSVVNITGHFKETQSRAVIEMSINLILSIILGYFYGMYGVLIGTIVALYYRGNDFIWYVNKHILHQSVVPTYCRWIVNIALLIGVVWIFKKIPLSMTGYLPALLSICIIGFCVLVIFIIVNVILFRKDLAFLKNYKLLKEEPSNKV